MTDLREQPSPPGQQPHQAGPTEEDVIAVQRVLVTGAAGRIGRGVLDVLARESVAATALVLEDPGDLAADRVVVGDAGSPEVAARAVEGADAVVHLAAIPTPMADPPEVVFGTNTMATFAVLDAAGRAGVRRAVIASSQAAWGTAFAQRELHPVYLPVDVDTPDQAADPYALSKRTDELTADMMARRHGMSVVALRYPFVGGMDERLRARADEVARDPGLGARNLWAYLETRDAAEAAWLALAHRADGAQVVYVAAPDTLVPMPTAELLRRYHPDVPLRRPVEGYEVPIDLGPAERLLGFRARHLVVGTP
ncbi:Nucleoside-diphosphate-sugar epimerase [Promicromonospora thailandica]|uniref:Nucleoside-diphosphate-sugar epimerase n=1 Tax=Promicromonospora thailandica TaxID=765201 RepID=A0A9X2G6I2_9MICO|nr:Nucleoside-diphosphate-sugar epimerase [Promicromonospora thailandica]BFF18136.1 NAD(P)-dependent oxidoreductase [Promicromonospora thailandica]